MNNHLNTPPPALAKTRPDLAALDPILAKALSKNPADRYSRCTDFARALAARDTPPLAEATSVGPTMQAPTPPPKQPRSTPNQHAQTPPAASPPPTPPADKQVSKAMWVAVAAVGVAVGALALVWTQRQNPPSSPPPTPQASTSVSVSQAPLPSTSTQTVTKTVLPPPSSPRTYPETTPPVRAPVWVGTITGTCDEGGSCGVKQRNAPRNAAPGITSQPLVDGTRVGIVCQTIGDTRQNAGYGSSNLWYQIASGAFIPAVYVSTGTEGFPQC